MLKNANCDSTRKQRCCVKTRRRKDLVAAPGCTEDDAAVATLPEKWVPRHSGPVLANYLKTQEQNHLAVLDESSKVAATINEGIDAKIREIAESLLAHIKQNELDMNCVVEGVRSFSPTPLPPEDRNQALKQTSDIYARRIESLASFRREAEILERRRADELRKLLRDQFQRLIKVGHRPPRDLLHEFDQQMYEVNQQLLSNSRAYLDLEAHLHEQADANLVRVKSSLNEMCLGVSKMYHRFNSSYSSRDDKIPYSSGNAHEKNRESMDPTLAHIYGDVETFEQCAALLVQGYKAAVLKVFSGFSGKLLDLHNHLGYHSYIESEPQTSEIADLQRMIEGVLHKLSISIHKNQPISPELIDMTRFGTLKMQKSLFSLGERLRDTYTILHDSGHLWDAHMFRSGLAQKLTIAVVEDLLTNNDTLELSNEVPFNIALEQLRGASDIEKLQQQYDVIIAMLDRTAEMYKQHSDAEMGKLEEFMSFPETMANTLMSEFQCFLEKYPRSYLQKTESLASQWGISSPRLDAKSFRMQTPRIILQTELQEVSLLNWRNGFLETFENNVSLVPDELTHHARMWVEEKQRVLRMRYSMKLVSHSIRLERVKAARDYRLAELKTHDSRLESHLDAVYDLVDRLPTEAAEFLGLDAPELYPFCDWVSNIQAKIDNLLVEEAVDPETKRLKMCSYAPRLVKYRSLFENSLDLAMEACKRQIENRVQEARISNVRIASQLKLFGEGGRYSAQEATRASASLMRGADAIESCLTRSIDALNHRRKGIMEMADQRLVPLQRIVDEFAKSGGKGGMDKKKPLPGKKK